MPENASQRTEHFKHNAGLNHLLDELRTLLAPVQGAIQAGYPSFPVGTIVGIPRSGTTLFLQWLSSLGCFSYPSNVLTRFAYAPYIGALVQQMLFDPDLDYHGDFSDLRSGINHSSELGKSKGALACNEFQHFFRTFMPNFDLEWLDESALKQTDSQGISNGLASIEKAFGKPFMTKGSLLQLNIRHFADRIPSLFWLHISREPLFVMQSILRARENYYGNRNTWWSSKPKEYDQLKEMDIYHQIAGQVYFTDKSIKEGLESIPDSKSLTIKYEDFCAEPEMYYDRIYKKYSELGCELPKEYRGAASFKVSNKISLPSSDIDALQEAYNEFNSQ